MKINGSLVFDASSASEIQNLRVQKYANYAAIPAHTGAADAGRLVYAADLGTLYKGNATMWEAIATGGSAFSQAEGDAIEASLGAGIATDGTFVAAGFPTQPGLTSPTSFTDAINQLAAYATANNELAELDDVTLSSAHTAGMAAGPKFLFTAGGGANWADHTLVLADVSDVTTTATELNQLHTGGAVLADFVKLHAITTSAAQINNATATTATTTELNYVSGVTSAIQTQLNGKQPLNTGLSSVSTLLDGSGTGIIVQTGVDTVANRTLVAPAAGITISNPAGVAGDITFALANDLAALEGLTTTGYIVRTGDGSATTRSIAGTVSNIVVTNGDGVASDTSINLAGVTQAATGDFVKVTLDGFGRVTGNTAVTTADITGLVDSTYVNVTGDTMTGSLTMATGTHITLTDTATSATDAVNKAYVDALAAGLSWKQAVKAASTAPLTLATGFAAGQVIDGVTLVAGNRILVKDQAAPAENGIYIVTAGAPTRATDMDAPAEFEAASVLVQEGTTQKDFGYTQINAVATVGTDPVVFHQFTGSSVLTAGVGLEQVANVLNVKMGAGVVELPTGEVGIDLYNAAGGNLALILTLDGTTHSTASGAQLFLLLDSGSGLAQTATGLKINAASVTNAMLATPSITLNSDGGTATLSLGGTLEVKGTSVQGISTANTGTSVTITAADASSSQKGVAKFDSNDFTVTAGNVTIATGGVDNGQLANSSITITGSTGSDAVFLGESVAIIGDGAAITTAMGANSLAISARDATVSLKGVASFPAAQFSVAAGAVTIATTFGQGALTNVAATVDGAAEGALLAYNGTSSKWENRSPATVAGTMLLGDLSDVGSASPTSGQALIGNGTTWNTQKIYHLETVAVAATTWTVSHALGVKYCNVTVVDSTDNVVIPQSVVFDSTSQLTVTFNTAITGKVVVMGVA